MADFVDTTTRALAASVNLRQIRHNVTAANIANAETPGYSAKKMDFEDSLARALDLEGSGVLQGTVPEHSKIGPGAIGRVKADIYDDPDGAVNNDGNTVDIEKEMSSLAENSIMYKAAMQLINKKLAALKYAASEGGR